ncbi:hypothetical protein [Halioglobus maricola]|uniref:hypothetical protein n=1 Tax=Halioglobus maricola TaxID=2601894 RepID=UPI00197ACD54|nr:hypothetical protein [Halioglobus maricola]
MKIGPYKTLSVGLVLIVALGLAFSAGLGVGWKKLQIESDALIGEWVLDVEETRNFISEHVPEGQFDLETLPCYSTRLSITENRLLVESDSQTCMFGEYYKR